MSEGIDFPQYAGRTYAWIVVMAYYEDDRLVSKDIAFTRWATALMAVTRRTLAKDPASFLYFGPEALRLKADGFFLRP